MSSKRFGVLLAIGVAIAAPASAGVLRSASIDLSLQGYGALTFNAISPGSGDPELGSLSAGGAFTFYGFLSPPAEAWRNATAPISEIHAFVFVAAFGGNTQGTGGGLLEGGLSWFANGTSVAGGVGPTLISPARGPGVHSGVGGTFTVFDGDFALGSATATGLTLAGQPHPTAPTVRAAGGVTVTPSGDVHVQLVSLGRICARGLETSTRAFLARATLVYAPEPHVGALLGAAAVIVVGRGLCCSRRARS